MTALGERILAELGEAETTDTLTRWLTHHVARLVDAADRARAAGEPDADARDAEARTAILELWQHRSTWPSGWPPPRAAAIVRVLDGLPELEDPAWFRVSAVGRLQDLHHHALALLADLVAASGDGVEEGWLRRFGEHLTADEATLLARAAGAAQRLDRLLHRTGPALTRLRRRLALGGAEATGLQHGEHLGGDDPTTSGGEADSQPPHPLLQLADAYRDAVADLLHRAGDDSYMARADDDEPWTGEDDDIVAVR